MFYDRFFAKLVFIMIINVINWFFLGWDLFFVQVKKPFYKKLSFLTELTYYSISIYHLINLFVHISCYNRPAKLCRIYSGFIYKEMFKFIFIISNLVFIMFWGLFIFDRKSLLPKDAKIPIILNLWVHGFITVTLYLDLFFLNPHLMHIFKHTLLEIESFNQVNNIKKWKLLKDYFIIVCLVGTYFLILVIFKTYADFYPYPFTQKYDLGFWIIMLIAILVCFLVYLWYKYLTTRVIDSNINHVNDETMLELLNHYLKNIRQE